MDEAKKFPPRRAYSLKEAAQLLGCSIEALLDWGNIGTIKICLKVTEKTILGKLKDSIYAFGARGIEQDEYPCTITAKIYHDTGNWFDAGQTFIMMQPLTNEKADELGFVSGEKIEGASVRWPCRIAGFWQLERGHLYTLTEKESAPQIDMLLRPYGLSDEEKTDRGGCVCVANIALTVDDLFLMRTEFENLRDYKPEDGQEAIQVDGETNQYGIIDQRHGARPKSKRDQQKTLILQAIADLGYEASSFPVRKGGKTTVKNRIGTSITLSAFDATWQELRDEGKIRDAT